MNYDVKVTTDGINIDEITQVDSGDTITVYNEKERDTTVDVTRGLANITSVTIVAGQSDVIDVIAVENGGLYYITLPDPKKPQDPLKLTIKMGGNGGDHKPRAHDR